MCAFICLYLVSDYRVLIKKAVLICLLLSPGAFAVESANASAGLVYQDLSRVMQHAPLLNTSVEMHINGLINRVKVTQRFVNDSENWINARYLFPLPDNAALDHLQMIIGTRKIIGKIQEKTAAQKSYAKAKLQGRKASLIEQQAKSLFSTAVANIGPHETVQIEIEYQQRITYQTGVFSLYFPMAITPRYAPEITPLKREQRQAYLNCLATKMQTPECEEKWNTWLQEKQALQIAEQTSANIKGEGDANLSVDMHIYLDSPLAVKNIGSPYHGINIEQKGHNDHVITLQNTAVIADRDFVLNWQLVMKDEPQSAVFVEQQGSEQYGTVMIVPPAAQFTESGRISKEVIFVIDVSGSMSGSSITQAKSALRFAIEQLGERDTFNIIAFSDRSAFFAGNALPVDKRSKVMAKDFIDSLRASGGTNMEAALQAALIGQRTVYANKEQQIRQVVFITDASISNEEQLLDQIAKQLDNSRLFMVGIGSAPNHYFMKASAVLGKGSYTNIGRLNEVKQKMSVLFSQLSAPMLSDINVTWADGSELDYWPKPLPDLYSEAPLELIFTIPKEKKTLHINGLISSENIALPWSQEISLGKSKKAQGVAKLWAKAQIDSLDLNRDLSAQQKKQQITALGLAFHLVTNYTSLVAIEQHASRPALLQTDDVQVKRHLPYGSTMALPQTGLATDLYKKIGSWLLLVGGILWLIELYYQQSRRNRSY